MKAVIPAAGFGTRFLPATKAQPKEMLPVFDKPTIQYVIEEAVNSGIDDILIVTGRNEARLNDTLNQLEGEGHLAIAADITDEASITSLVEACPCLDGLVNNAGSTIMIPTQFITREKLQYVLDVNTIAPILLTQMLLKKKKLNRGGAVVITDSISGVRIASPGNVLYSTSKSAMDGFMKRNGSNPYS